LSNNYSRTRDKSQTIYIIERSATRCNRMTAAAAEKEEEENETAMRHF
jgi:hypothetical protein